MALIQNRYGGTITCNLDPVTVTAEEIVNKYNTVISTNNIQFEIGDMSFETQAEGGHFSVYKKDDEKAWLYHMVGEFFVLADVKLFADLIMNYTADKLFSSFLVDKSMKLKAQIDNMDGHTKDVLLYALLLDKGL